MANDSPSTVNKNYRRYQLQWRPTFARPADSGAGGATLRTYILGEKIKLLGYDTSEMSPTNGKNGYDNNAFPYSEMLRVAYNSTLILPFNTSVALAQEYSPGVRNKVVTYNTLGGNTVTTFGQAVKKIGLRIKIIKAGDNWKVYYRGLEAMAYLSANQGRFFGSLFLLGYDTFPDKTQALISRYKVVVESLDFGHRSDTNTVISADLQMFVTHDYSAQLGEKKNVWGSL